MTYNNTWKVPVGRRKTSSFTWLQLDRPYQLVNQEFTNSLGC